MAKTIEIPEALYEQLAERAAAAGVPMGEYVLRELESMPAGEVTPPEVWDRLLDLAPVKSSESAAEMVRAVREEREKYLDDGFDRR